MPTKPPNKIKTQPGLGGVGSVAPMPRMDSAEMKRVKDSFRRDVERSPDSSRSSKSEPVSGRVDSDPPRTESTRPKLRDSVRREDPEDESDGAAPTSNPPRSERAWGGSSPPRGNSNSARPNGNSARPNGNGAPVSAQQQRSSPPARASQQPRRATSSWEAESPTGTRRKRSGRPPVTVDEVGTAAVKLARTTRRQDSAPKLVATRGMIAKAPIDTRAAFLLSLIDGRNTVDSIVDMSGMNDEEVKAILERLARLGLISLPA